MLRVAALQEPGLKQRLGHLSPAIALSRHIPPGVIEQELKIRAFLRPPPPGLQPARLFIAARAAWLGGREGFVVFAFPWCEARPLAFYERLDAAYRPASLM